MYIFNVYNDSSIRDIVVEYLKSKGVKYKPSKKPKVSKHLRSRLIICMSGDKKRERGCAKSSCCPSIPFAYTLFKLNSSYPSITPRYTFHKINRYNSVISWSALDGKYKPFRLEHSYNWLHFSGHFCKQNSNRSVPDSFAIPAKSGSHLEGRKSHDRSTQVLSRHLQYH